MEKRGILIRLAPTRYQAAYKAAQKNHWSMATLCRVALDYFLTAEEKKAEKGE